MRSRTVLLLVGFAACGVLGSSSLYAQHERRDASHEVLAEHCRLGLVPMAACKELDALEKRPPCDAKDVDSRAVDCRATLREGAEVEQDRAAKAARAERLQTMCVQGLVPTSYCSSAGRVELTHEEREKARRAACEAGLVARRFCDGFSVQPRR